jgi:hypothetical protein
MDWFKNNPFLGGLALATASSTAVMIYFTLGAQQELSAQKEEFMTLSGRLSSIQSGKPFPNQANLDAGKAELDQAKKILSEISSKVREQSEPLNAALSPQQFQDALNARVAAISKTATDNGVTLPESFYLGFDQYRSQPPAPSAAPQLGQQLESIAEAVSLLLQNKVRAIDAVTRPPLPIEGAATPEETSDHAQIFLVPFDVEFTTDQANFRQSLDALIKAEPILFIRAVQVVNSAPKSPLKSDSPVDPAPASGVESGDPSEQVPAKASIPVIFGQEQLSVKLRLSSISTPASKKTRN